MTILDTFYLLFKSDTSGAKNDVKALETQIDALMAKGKKRSDAETKQMLEARKHLQSITQEFKEQGKQVDQLGGSFVKLIEGAVGALAAYTSFSALKSGLINAEKLNSVLYVNQQITGQNAGELKAWANVVEDAGGSAEAFYGTLKSWTEQAAAAGQPLQKVSDLMRYIHDQIKGQPKQEQRRILGIYGITDPAQIALLEQADSEFEKTLNQQQKYEEAVNRAAPASRAFEEQLAKTKHSFEAVFSAIDADILPPLTDLLGLLQNMGDWFVDHEHAAEGFFTIAALGASKLSGAVVGLTASFLGLGKTAAAAAEAEGAAVAGTSLSTVVAGGFGAWQIGKGIGDIITGKRESWLGQGADKVSDWLVGQYDDAVDEKRGRHNYGTQFGPDRPGSGGGRKGSTQQESLDYWISQGYTPYQAAGIVANEKRESGFNPKAIGDGGAAVGSFQWHRDRVKRIYEGTGIDVRSASHADQLKAAQWELQQSGLDQAIKSTGSAGGAAALFSRRFERPANGDFEAATRANMAARIIGESSFQTPAAGGGGMEANKTVNIKIDDVNVSTQATDAAGIARGISSHLANEMRNTAVSIDDGVLL